MEPITLITTAILAALATGADEVGKKVVVDAYEGLKGLIKKRWGENGALPKAVVELESEPASEGRKLILQDKIKESKAYEDPEILRAAQTLLDQLKAQPGGEKRIQQIAIGNNIAIAEGGSTASVAVNQLK